MKATMTFKVTTDQILEVVCDCFYIVFIAFIAFIAFIDLIYGYHCLKELMHGSWLNKTIITRLHFITVFSLMSVMNNSLICPSFLAVLIPFRSHFKKVIKSFSGWCFAIIIDTAINMSLSEKMQEAIDNVPVVYTHEIPFRADPWPFVQEANLQEEEAILCRSLQLMSCEEKKLKRVEVEAAKTVHRTVEIQCSLGGSSLLHVVPAFNPDHPDTDPDPVRGEFAVHTFVDDQEVADLLEEDAEMTPAEQQQQATSPTTEAALDPPPPQQVAGPDDERIQDNTRRLNIIAQAVVNLTDQMATQTQDLSRSAKRRIRARKWRATQEDNLHPQEAAQNPAAPNRKVRRSNPAQQQQQQHQQRQQQQNMSEVVVVGDATTSAPATASSIDSGVSAHESGVAALSCQAASSPSEPLLQSFSQVISKIAGDQAADIKLDFTFDAELAKIAEARKSADLAASDEQQQQQQQQQQKQHQRQHQQQQQQQRQQQQQ